MSSALRGFEIAPDDVVPYPVPFPETVTEGASRDRKSVV